MKHWIAVCLISSLMAAFPMATRAETPARESGRAGIELTITGFENSDGVAMVSLVNSREMFENETHFRAARCPVIEQEAHLVLEDLPLGDYALKVIHDENSNGELDTRMFGIPKEAYGFSRDARGQFGPPDYAEAVFHYGGGLLPIAVHVQ